MSILPNTWKGAQAQASLALQQHRAAQQAGDNTTADLLMTRAQLLIERAVQLDDRPRPSGWERYEGDGRRPT
jgi:hypothetical protein